MNEKLITKEIKDQIIQKIRAWWEVNFGRLAVIGISGGKDSSVVAALFVEALGKENVLGVLLPDGDQKDIEDSKKLCKHLGIENVTLNINSLKHTAMSLIHEMNKEMGLKRSRIMPRADYTRYTTNLPPRIRMAMLYAVAQNYGGRVINTSNASESYVGWGTLFGDTVGDFAPIKNLYVDEVVELGKLLKLPKDLVEKRPADGLTDKTDEENLGFSYADVKKVALKCEGWQTDTAFADIEEKHKNTQFKRDIINVPGIDFYRTKYGKITSVK